MSDKKQKPQPPITDHQSQTTQDACQIEIDQLKNQLNDVEGKWKRALADYQNLERHMKVAQVQYIKLATKDFVESLIEPFDNLLLASAHIQDKGLQMVIGQFQQVFESQGLKQIDPKGMQFDPQTMEAVDTKEGEEGKVVSVMSVGYELNGVVVKHAKVVVGITK